MAGTIEEHAAPCSHNLIGSGAEAVEDSHDMGVSFG